MKRARYPSPPDSGYKTKKARKADKEAEPTTPTGQKQGTQMSKHGADDEDKETIEIDQGKDLQSASGHYKRGLRNALFGDTISDVHSGLHLQ